MEGRDLKTPVEDLINRNESNLKNFVTYTVFVEGDDEKGVIPLRRTANSLIDLLSPHFA